MAQKVSRKSTRDTTKLLAGPIHAIYLFYIEKSGYTRFYETWDPKYAIPEDEARDKIKMLTVNAFKGEYNPPYYTDKRKYMVMRRVSYVAFVVNGNDWNPGTSTSLAIEGTNHFDGPIRPDSYHTFTNREYFEFEEAGQMFWVIYYQNSLTSSLLKDDLADEEKEKFTFTLPYLTKEAHVTAPDSGGTNMGPPVPPPTFVAPV